MLVVATYVLASSLGSMTWYRCDAGPVTHQASVTASRVPAPHASSVEALESSRSCSKRADAVSSRASHSTNHDRDHGRDASIFIVHDDDHEQHHDC